LNIDLERELEDINKVENNWEPSLNNKKIARFTPKSKIPKILGFYV